MNTTKRILWIDYAKAICIYLVLLGHAHVPPSVADFIYAFHMPLFFFLSGALFSFEKYASFKDFALKRFKRIMVPYFLINLITYLFWLLVTKNFGEDASNPIPWHSPLIGIFTGNTRLMVHNMPMWFFICLYVLEMIYYLVFKPLKNHRLSTLATLLVIATAAYINYKFNPVTLPFCLGPALVGMVFYGIGNLLTKHIVQIRQVRLRHIVLLLFAFCTVLLVARKNGLAVMSLNDYNNYILFLTGSLAGICMICTVANLLSIKPAFKNVTTYISKNTLLVNSFQLSVFSAIKGVMVFVLHIPLALLYGHTAADMFFSAIALLLCLPLAYIINLYFPLLAGK